LIEALAPSPKKPTVIEIKPAAPPAAAPAPVADEAAAATQETPAAASAEKPPEGGTPSIPTPVDEPTPEQTAIIADLHWLVHQGHVLEFADGRMDTAKKPLPRPPKPEKKAAGEKPAVEGGATPTTVEPEGDTAILTEAEIPASEPELAVEPEPAAEATAETPVPTEPVADVPASEPAAGEGATPA
jgi:hypothetical protein